MKLYAPWEKAFEKISTPLENFIHAQTTTGLILFFTTIIALILANSPFAETYQHIFHIPIAISIGSWQLSQSLSHWINDGLMTFFFFLVGLEIKREILIGELSNIKVAILPILAAIGGMIFPALIYMSINADSPGANGWGIPMATDIAFAISALVILGHRVSPALVTFLIALAIVDDLGAVVVIAIFYTEQIHLLPLFLAGVSFLIMVSFNRFGIHMILPYLIIGTFMWLFMLESGIHATIAGVIAAFAIPSKPNYTPVDFTAHTKNLLEEYDNYPVATDHTMHEKQKAILQNIKDKINAVSSPAARLEHTLHLPIGLIVIPLFALANAGVSLNFTALSDSLAEPVSLGIILGLLAGKIIGIFGVSYLSIKLSIATLPQNSTMSQLFGVAALGGIGFTMSIFVAELAFAHSEELLIHAKVGILLASMFAGFIGFIWLRFIAKPPTKSGTSL
ncbi:Na+/H+ antiporter NhaA [Sulfurimonas autotrophica]|uniref:Na(+)/H(+) antiporter NhaA n=1 Tax=Sulfurimonas autotrophica (strain ATCC BAA-671 / DSM 16294 / JCM 11897 / OK10) TaxID=563040 RepID=E0UUV8_SULAO|nr:Na+/H+ antiporter NhaA [Sulfurimonas autotrophica]ADN08470.1 sodium/proton antiporter, NhaA family [Sulfurimonas autotrophica DSM 16294]